jgi:phosphatidylserine/phosphatidylglycerophosphate/cardiolipin synthase-like enzyme
MQDAARYSICLWALWVAFAAIALPPGDLAPALSPPWATVRFSPRGGAGSLTAWHIDRARWTVHVASYQWSNRKVHDAVVRARRRGCQVRVLVDDSSERRPLVQSLLAAGFVSAGMPGDTLRVDDRHKIFHDKYTLRDAADPALAAVETGSFNYSTAADEDNAENALVIEGHPDVAADYLKDWEKHWAHARSVKVD